MRYASRAQVSAHTFDVRNHVLTERMGLPEEVTFSGIGGELMKKEGLDPIFDMSELSVSDPLCRRMHCALPGADKADRPTR